MAYEISGTIKKIFETQTFPSGFSKREFVITTADRFPQDILLACLKDKVSLLDEVTEGQTVNVHFDISGREYNGRYFVNLNAWKLEPAEGGSAADTPADRAPEDVPERYGDDAPF